MRLARQMALVLACAGTPLALTACAGDDSERIEAVFSSLRQAYLTEDYAGLCAQMSSVAQGQVGEIGHRDAGTCRRDFEDRMSAAILSRRDLVEPEIHAIRVSGDRAVVSATLGGSAPGRVAFAREGGEWKLDKVFAVTAPPPPDLR